MWYWLDSIQGALLIGMLINCLIGDPLPAVSLPDLLTGLLPRLPVRSDIRPPEKKIRIGLWLRLTLVAASGSVFVFQLIRLSGMIAPWLQFALKIFIAWQFLSARQRFIRLKRAETAFKEIGTSIALHQLSKTTERLIDMSDIGGFYQTSLRRTIRLSVTRWIMPLLCMLSGQWILLAGLRLFDQAYERMNLHSLIYEWLIFLPQLLLQGMMKLFLAGMTLDTEYRQSLSARYLNVQLPVPLKPAPIAAGADEHTDKQLQAGSRQAEQAADESAAAEEAGKTASSAGQAIDLRDLRCVRSMLRSSLILFTLFYLLFWLRKLI